MAELREEPAAYTKPATTLLPKALLLAAIAVSLPLFPQKTPDFFGELLHLILVGVAITYGLFSSRNFDPSSEKSPPPKSGELPYVPDLFEVSELFNGDRNFQVWSSQHRREEDSTVVLAEDRVAEGAGALLLPLRSLKGTAPEETLNETLSETLSETLEEKNEDLKKTQTKKKFHIPPPPPPPPPFECYHPLRPDIEVKSRVGSFYKVGRSVRTLKVKERVQECCPKREDEEEGGVVLVSEDSEEEKGRVEGKEGDDVDKKADEFIAKFREQIRLQRIENMKRGSASRRKT